MSKAAIYIRTSTQEQHGDAQKQDMIVYCENAGIMSAEWFIDIGISGATVDRPDFQRLCAAIRQGKIKHLYCWKLDRLGRVAADIDANVRAFTSSGCKITTLKEGTLDPSTAMGRFGIQLLASLAELERSSTRERCNSGRAAAKARGVVFGRPSGMDPDEVKKAKELRAKFWTYRDIGTEMQIPFKTVYRTLAAGERYRYVAPQAPNETAKKHQSDAKKKGLDWLCRCLPCRQKRGTLGDQS